MVRTGGVKAVFALGFVLAEGAGWAQQYVMSTLAGGAHPALPAAALQGSIGTVHAIAADAAGNIYFSSWGFIYVFKLDPSGVITRIAGNSTLGFSGDGGPAASAQLGDCYGLAVDDAGNLFIAEATRVRKVSTAGIIVTVAGNGVYGFAGDGGPATNAAMSVSSIAVDTAGNLFIGGGSHVRKVSPSGIITTVAGNGVRGITGDGGPAVMAGLYQAQGVAVDGAGNLFIADYRSIRKVAPNGIITRVAGNGGEGFSGDGGPATDASLQPNGIGVDSMGNLFIADGTNRIRKLAPDGTITTVAGNGEQDFSGDGGPATSAAIRYPGGLAVDAAGNLFIADSRNSRIRRVSPSGLITTVAGNGACCDYDRAASPFLVWPSGVAVDAARNVFIADAGNARVLKVSPDGFITRVAGSGAYSEGNISGDSGPATEATLGLPTDVAVDTAGNLFIIDFGRVRKVAPNGIITTVAGNGTFGFSGDGGPATSAALKGSSGIAVDSAGNLFISDSSCVACADGNNRIRKVSANGTITTVAGNGTAGFSGDGGPATSAEVQAPHGLTVDQAGNLFLADSGNNRIRMISSDGVITTIAGNGGEGFAGDGGPATKATFRYPTGVALDGAGNLLVADLGNGRIRRISPDGIVNTIAGNGQGGFSGDGGSATSASMQGPVSLAVDNAGNVYVADSVDYDQSYDNGAVRMLRPLRDSVLITAVRDAARQSASPISPGKIVVIDGIGLGPSELIKNVPQDGRIGTALAGTAISCNGIAAPILYTSATQVAAIVPYAVSGTTAEMTVTYQGKVSAAVSLPLAGSAPSLFTSNQSGSGQAAAINAADGTANTAANPAKTGSYVSFYATGEGQTVPPGLDGGIAGSTLAGPVLPVTVTVDGLLATVQYAGGAPGLVAGLMQVNVQIPIGVKAGGYVPVVLQVGDRISGPAVWIAVSGN